MIAIEIDSLILEETLNIFEIDFQCLEAFLASHFRKLMAKSWEELVNLSTTDRLAEGLGFCDWGVISCPHFLIGNIILLIT